MHLIICVDNKNGIAFNDRRQSRDKVLCEKIVKLSAYSPLWMTPYSAKLFVNKENIRISDTPMEDAEGGEFCFTEKQLPGKHEEKIESLIIFRWNRDYPADMHLDIDLSNWHMARTEDFEGKSHEKITMEVFEKI